MTSAPGTAAGSLGEQLAGLAAYYNTRNWHYAYLTVADDGRRVLELMSCDTGRRTLHPGCQVDATGTDQVRLRVELDGPVVRFAYAFGPGTAGDWRELPAELDATILSDEHAAHKAEGEPEAWCFTGAFVGPWVQDLGLQIRLVWTPGWSDRIPDRAATPVVRWRRCSRFDAAPDGDRQLPAAAAALRELVPTYDRLRAAPGLAETVACRAASWVSAWPCGRRPPRARRASPPAPRVSTARRQPAGSRS